MELYERIKDFPLFKDFPEDRLKKLKGLVEEISFNDGEVILNETSSNNSLFIILSGRVNIFRKEHLSINMLSVLEQGDVFGEVSFIDSMARSANASAEGKVELGKLPYDNFKLLANADPLFAMDFVIQLMKELTRKFRAVSGGMDIKSPDYTFTELMAGNMEVKIVTASGSEYIGVIKFAERRGTAPLLKLDVKGQIILLPFHQIKAIVLPNRYGKF